MQRSELLLVKPSQIEAFLNQATERQSREATVWDKFVKQYEGLTTMTRQGNTAIIPFRGMVTPDDPTAILYGETNLSMVLENFNAALADSSIDSIVFNVYSPGGYVYGVEAASNAIYDARGTKPIIAYTDSLAASAAYMFASAADKVVLGSETAEVGSIGVYLAHFDYSQMLDKMGIKVTEITSGEYKGIGSPYSPMSEEEKKALQADSNYVYTRFVNTVARNRGMAVEDVLKSANGLTFYGSDAIKAGLADSINSLQEVIAMSTPATGNNSNPNDAAAAAAAQAQQTAAAEARAKKAEEELAAFRAQQTAEANARNARECKELIKTNLGREATDQEVSAYQSMNEEGRSLYRATVAEGKANRDKLLNNSSLTREMVSGNPAEGGGTPIAENGIVRAMISMGIADDAKVKAIR